jgi:hypothetical protein
MFLRSVNLSGWARVLLGETADFQRVPDGKARGHTWFLAAGVEEVAAVKKLVAAAEG